MARAASRENKEALLLMLKVPTLHTSPGQEREEHWAEFIPPRNPIAPLVLAYMRSFSWQRGASHPIDAVGCIAKKNVAAPNQHILITSTASWKGRSVKAAAQATTFKIWKEAFHRVGSSTRPSMERIQPLGPFGDSDAAVVCV
eukprot:CAMPEP_0119544786 /NCGR_PEP_ID=MMETSP1344-20130328/54865_1 /TAXON_ID=236787 /ORGANISM="Florenciella parvula, Strain CCMP2471" /LENGTH=142 /DNA_ID=CAMNT_0007589293 /DNA_START=846 /DNA_END=1275 /DNA_ORIENTATION=+